MLLKMSEVSERLNCSISNVYSLDQCGRLSAICTGATGKGYRVAEEELQRFMDSRQHARAPQPWPEKTNPRSKGKLFVMLDGERLREAWHPRDVDAR
jgi:excisionase family DNA binding protein